MGNMADMAIKMAMENCEKEEKAFQKEYEEADKAAAAVQAFVVPRFVIFTRP